MYGKYKSLTEHSLLMSMCNFKVRSMETRVLGSVKDFSLDFYS